MLSPEVVALCRPGQETLTSALADNPSEKPSDVAESLFKSKNKISEVFTRLAISKDHAKTSESETPSQEELDQAATCGAFPYRPSDLFLSMYIAAIRTLERDPLAGMVSPSLMGSSGVIPLTIISVIPEIMKHYAQVIIAAEHEVMLATNFWVSSKSSKIITDAMRELSRRAIERGGKRIVFKLIYDRGNIKQVAENHIVVPEKEFTGKEVEIPAFDEVPGLQLEVVNYHRPAVGTFHAKYMIVDRKIALLNSNNIQDRCNMEMMCHYEGPIVQSIYDMGLLSWSISMKPPLPLLQSEGRARNEESYRFGLDNPYVAARPHINGLDQIHSPESTEQPSNPGNGQAIPSSADRIAAITEYLNCDLQPDTKGNLPATTELEPFRPNILHEAHKPFPIALVNRRPHGRPGHGDTVNPQDAAWLAGFRFAKKSVFIQTPTFNAPPVVEACLEAVKRGILCTLYLDLGFNDEGELLPYQGGTNEDVSEKMYHGLEEEERHLLQVYWYTGKDMNRPINAKEQKRNCHVKLMIVDGCVGIQGNGNQDSQSWFHSQEINAMIDSPRICEDWAAGIRAVQNTHLYGELALDGKWKDKDGHLLPGAHGANTGPFKSLKGVTGAIKRVQGKGGF